DPAGTHSYTLSLHDALPISEREKVPVETFVVRELRVEARCKEPSLSRRDDGVVREASEHLHTRPDATDPRRADEHSVEGRLAERLYIEVSFERVDLTTERVAFDGHVHEGSERMRV